MHNLYRAIFISLFFFLPASLTFAAAGENGTDSTGNIAETTDMYSPQPAGEIEMADVMRSNGMIYVVVGVVLIVLAGLIIYLISVDRKVAKLEREVMDREKEAKK